MRRMQASDRNKTSESDSQGVYNSDTTLREQTQWPFLIFRTPLSLTCALQQVGREDGGR